MPKISIIKELTATIKEYAFKGTTYEELRSLDKSAWREIILQNTERILGQDEDGKLAEWLVSKFYEEPFFMIPSRSNPLINAKGEYEKNILADLSQDEKNLTYLIFRVAELTGMLLNNNGVGIEELDEGLSVNPMSANFHIGNEDLVKWINSTHYRRIAYLIVRQLVFNALNSANNSHLSAVKVYISREYGEKNPNFLNIYDCNNQIERGVNCLKVIALHNQKAASMSLYGEEREVVDALWGWIPHDYPTAYVRCAEELIELANKLLDSIFIDGTLEECKFENEFFNLAGDIIRQYGIKISRSPFSLSQGYLSEWLNRIFENRMFKQYGLEKQRI